MCAIANRLDLSNKCLRSNSSSRPQSSRPVQVRSGDGGLSVPEMGMCPGKSRQSWKRAKPQRTVQERSQDTVIYPLLKSPPPSPPPQQIQQRKRNESKRVRQNKAVGSANNHGAPWPCVGNEGREGRRNVRQVVLMKGIAVLSAVHSANC